MSPILITPTVALVLGALPATALSNRVTSLDTPAQTWLSGFCHPLLDLPHLSILLALGFVAAQLGGQRRWGLLLLFGALMGFGLVLAAQGAVAPVIDIIVLTTALCFGLLILARVPVAFAATATVAGTFALFHGLSDARIILSPADRLDSLLGFFAGNSAAYVVGLIIGGWIHRHVTTWTTPLRPIIARWRGRLLGA